MIRGSVLAAITAAAFVFGIGAVSVPANAAQACANINSGTITDSVGNVIANGYDQFGYNYQAHMFNGTYDSSDRVLDGTYWGGTGDYVDDTLIMKWSDSWLANVDCDGDDKLDRGLINGVADGSALSESTSAAS